jgi:hypothetical protein
MTRFGRTGLSEIRAEVRPRDGFGELTARLGRSECTIAYMGASVTAQRDGYRPRLHELIRARCGQAHAGINAGTGALGAPSGVFLMDRLVLRHRPDLCFVEYATRDLDGTASASTVGAALEGIVVKLRDSGCEPCFLYLYRSDVDFHGQNEVIAAYEAVAEHHRVPSIDVASAIEEHVASGAIRTEHVLRDVVHTTPAGGQLVADAIIDAVREIAATSRSRSGPREDLHPDSFRGAHMQPARLEWLRYPERGQHGRFRFSWDYVEVGGDNPIECSFDGELVGIVVIVGPSFCVIRVGAGKQAEEIALADPVPAYDHLGTVIFSRRYPAGRVVRIELTGAAETDGTVLRVVGFMVRA